ncbi:helix-turn-helix domain-containing protein [Sulfobacillus harzensis]|uniref:Helix-turn-helix transcriptional regulator n=1 Tax=Sulfobacillus harzensis TaxID=2729629 RepID=A0A7Y0Q241_9FIRM|nr:helix-turn-helix transcriptional regulator [Sulfobacillus harzensis]
MVGTKIRDLRKKIGLTQEQLAGPELTKSYVSQVELGRIRPSKNALEIIARRLGKPLGYFLDNDDDLRTIDVLLRASEALWMSQRLDEAATGLKEAQYLAERTGRDDILAKIQATMGRLELSRNNLAEAENHLRRALASSALEDSPVDRALSASALADVEDQKGYFNEALRWYIDSINAVQRLKPKSGARAQVLAAFGDFCRRHGEPKAALALYREAEAQASEDSPQAIEIAFKLAALVNREEGEGYWARSWQSFQSLPDGPVRARIAKEAVQASLHLGLTATAETLLRQVPVDSDGLTLGVELALMEDCSPETARLWAEHAIRESLAPDVKAKAYWALSRLQSRPEDRLQALKAAIALDPQNAGILRDYVLQVLNDNDPEQIRTLKSTLDSSDPVEIP